MLKQLIYIIIIALLHSTASATNFKSDEFTLKNGMQVVVIPNTKVPAVSHMVWYKTGAQDEPYGKSGIAHFLEHLMFKGTKKYSQGEFSRIIAKNGGNDNAFTSADYTAYYQNIAKDKLELVMDMESDRMQNLILDKDEILKERDVILEERSSRIDNNPSALLNEQMKAVLFLNHPYGRPLIGWKHEMERLTIEDARKWYKDYYSPNNAVLIVSGDITAQELKPLAEKYYGEILPRALPKHYKITEPEHITPVRISLSDNKITKPEWIRYYIAPSQNTSSKKHCYPLILLSYILGDSNTSRLYQKLTVEEQIAASIDSNYEDVARGPAIFSIHAIPTNEHDLDDVEQAVDKQIDRIKRNGITVEELKRAQKALIAQTIYAREDLKTLGYIYGQLVAGNIDISYVNNWEDNINAVTIAQVKNAAKEILKIENSVTGRLVK